MRVVFIHLNPVPSQLIAWQGGLTSNRMGHVHCEATAWPWQTFPSEHLRSSCKSSICPGLATLLSLLSPPYSSQTAVLGFLHILLSPFGLLCFSSCVHRYQVFSPLCCCCFSLHQPHGLTLVPQCLFLEVPYLKSIKAIISLLLFINAGMILFFLAINITYGIHWKNEALYYTIMSNFLKIYGTLPKFKRGTHPNLKTELSIIIWILFLAAFLYVAL